MRFEKVDTQEKFEAWREFAKTFDHDTDSPLTPLVTITNEKNQLIGHFSELASPVVFPAFHPSISPREFRDSVEAISAYYCMSSMGLRYPSGVLFTALPKNMKVDHSKKMGFEELGVNLYRRLG